MLFGIAIVVLAIVIAVLINKSKISQVVDKVEEAVAPAVKEVKEVVTKASDLAPENKVVAETKVAVGTVVAAIEANHAKKRGPKPGNKAGTNKPKQNTKKK